MWKEKKVAKKELKRTKKEHKRVQLVNERSWDCLFIL